jgi:flagellar biosynthesis/type III secretory pathway chaperone
MIQTLIEKLILVLRQTERSYQELLPMIQTEKEMVCEARIEALLSVSTEKKKLLIIIQQLDQKRDRLLRQIATELNLDYEKLTLPMLTDYGDAQQSQQLGGLRQSLKSILSKVRASNNENRALIQHCLVVVGHAISFVLPQSETPSIYGASGAMAQRGRGGKLVSNAV